MLSRAFRKAESRCVVILEPDNSTNKSSMIIEPSVTQNQNLSSLGCLLEMYMNSSHLPQSVSGGVDLENSTNKTENAVSVTPGQKPGRNRLNRLRPHEGYSDDQKIILYLFKMNNSIKFFLIKAVSGKNLAETNAIQANRQLCAVLWGSPKRTTKLKHGSTGRKQRTSKT